jgi:peptide/nickel transport system permease protein
MVLSIWVISVITFTLFWASGARPAREICNYHCTTERIDEINAAYGWDKPLVVQYGNYMSGLINPNGRVLGVEGSELQCDWPCMDRSIHSGQPVWDTIAGAFWPTFWLAAGAAVLWLWIGVCLGIVAALHQGRRADRISVGLALVGASFPTLVLGHLLYFVFIIKLQLLPAPEPGTTDLFAVGPGPWLKAYILPWITLALVQAALYTRLTRATMIDSMREDFITTARAKGMSEGRVVVKHGLRAAIAPIVTIFGLDLGTLLGGAVITEQIFGIYGLGRVSVEAVLGVDLPIIMGVVLFAAIFLIVANVVVDIAYAVIDPRVRLQ